ncbi:MAG: S1C family serine protease [Alphaproteobacteria bacterium]|jgi:hypothetical protein|nr:S1C family serine protease [Alphaproteobacteria bacterium]
MNLKSKKVTTAIIFIISICIWCIYQTHINRLDVNELKKSVVEIVVKDLNDQEVLLGSGLYVGNGLFITNTHIIMSGPEFLICDYRGENYKVEGVVKYDENLDLAIIKTVEVLNIPKADIANTKKSKIGEEILTIGNPNGFKNSITEGIISGIRTIDEKKMIQISAPITSGSSGGPLINKFGKVIGINNSGYTNTNLNFAISIDYILDWLIELEDKEHKNIDIIDWKREWESRNEKTKEEIKYIIINFFKSLEEEDLNDFIKYIHPESPAYSFIRMYITPYFGCYDFVYDVEGIEILKNVNGILEVKVNYKIFKKDGGDFKNQQILAVYRFKKWMNEWKIYLAKEKVLYELSPFEEFDDEVR